MSFRWVSRAEARAMQALFDRRTDLTVESGALNPGSHMWPGFYYLVDARPVGGWKGNEWAILWTDWSKSMVEWYPTRDAADAAWEVLREEEAKQDAASTS